MCFLPSALNIKVKKLNEARANSGCNYDSFNYSLVTGATVREIRCLPVAPPDNRVTILAKCVFRCSY